MQWFSAHQLPDDLDPAARVYLPLLLAGHEVAGWIDLDGAEIDYRLEITSRNY